MAKVSGRTHVFSEQFDRMALYFGPSLQGNVSISKVVCKTIRTVHDWRCGRKACPRWAYELVRLTIDERRRVFEEMIGRYHAQRLRFIESGAHMSMAVGAHFGTSAANDHGMVVALPAVDKSDASR